MKVIRMLKTMAGPSGIHQAQALREVSDVQAAMLIGAGAAELVANLGADPPAETAMVDSGGERAVAPKPVAKKTTKKANHVATDADNR